MNQTAANMWSAMHSACEELPLLPAVRTACWEATCIFSDHAKSCKRVHARLHTYAPEWQLTVSGFCKQHATSLAVQPLSVEFDIIGPTFCIAKQFHMGAFCSSYMRAVWSVIDSRLEFIAEADPWLPQDDDQAYALQCLELCYFRRDLATCGLADDEERTKLIKEDAVRRGRGLELIRTCCGDWRSKRIIHKCRQGCCSNREEAVGHVLEAFLSVVSPQMHIPALNRWTQTAPVVEHTALFFIVHGIGACWAPCM